MRSAVVFMLVALMILDGTLGVKLDSKRMKKAAAILDRRKGKFGHGIKAAILEQKEIYTGTPPPPPPPPPGASMAEWKTYGREWLEHPMGRRFCWTSFLVSMSFAAMATLGFAARSWWAFHRRMVAHLWLVTLHNDTVHTSRQAAEKLAAVTNMTLDKAIIFVQDAHHTMDSTLVAHTKKKAVRVMRNLREVGLTVSIVREDRVHEVPDENGWTVRYSKEHFPCEKFMGTNWRIRGCEWGD